MPRIETAERAGVGLDGAERPSEDRVVVLPHAVVLLDGATAVLPGARSGGWYADRLCVEIGAQLRDDPGGDLADLLAEAIRRVALAHDLVPGQSPSSTVAILRWTETTVDALVLADSPIAVFDGAGTPSLLVDGRLAGLPRHGGGYRQRLRAGAGYGADHLAAVRESAARTGTLRNRPGGFWVAEADPAAAHQAMLASWPRETVVSALLATDGVSCGVDDYGVFADWSAVRELVAERGPVAALDVVREAERADPDGRRWPRPKRHDDQALVLVRFDDDDA
ncbi:hypothetical protein F0L68_07480 [Solihabitans fulvus]|uniref:Protein phosphatase 2C n=1 Tax=Solihabitans fulvus TaxID=1892852 RepID=A0A5B2XM01_9PSEU|nr:protein phosphatase 2C domain-containing protein [Solihabitans fulvus]KAA2264898.1 hypothetical protein F0L68_07480 [Solihabitans fulvus]